MNAQSRVAVYDNIGNSYPRKNHYLEELFSLEEQIKEATSQQKSALKKQLSELKSKKSSHPHNVKLSAFKTAEAAFKKELSQALSNFNDEFENEPQKRRNLRRRLFIAQKKADFYKDHVDLTYDAQLGYEQSVLEIKQLPEIIEFYDRIKKELDDARSALAQVGTEQQENQLQVFRQVKEEQQRKFKEGVASLRKKLRDGLISRKALRSETIALKHKRDEEISIRSYAIDKNSLKDIIEGSKYALSKGLKRKIKVLNANLSDIRRRVPMETENQVPWHAYIAILLPGLGQLLNKQYTKAALYSIGTFFVYFIAIPYALGYGNYQGEGIAGLISLAEGGRRIDRSLIFMIEGIIAIFLVLTAVVVIITSFRDALSTQKSSTKGMRPLTWYETQAKVEQEGFPIMVSMPALLVTVFIVLVPIVTALLISFTGMDPQNQAKFPWIGIDNYRLIALGEGLAGSVFWRILGWTLIWTFTATTLAIVVGFSLALIANGERIKGKAFFRTIYLLPWAVPAFITIMLFSIMFSPQGSITQILNQLFGETILVKNSLVYSRITLIGLQAWLGSAYVFLLSTGVLQAIPNDLYEAAQIDGATKLQKLTRVTLPIVLFQTMPLLIGQYTFNFNNFSIIYLFNGGGPFNPSLYGNLAGGTDLLISYIYKLTIENQYQAIGAAITIIISLGLMGFAFVGFKNSKAFKSERL